MRKDEAFNKSTIAGSFHGYILKGVKSKWAGNRESEEG